jgi:single-strand DNA-binding protein
MAYQKLTLVGNLGRDPEMRYLPNGNPVTNFTLATNRQYTNSAGEKVKEVTWFRISAWNKLAEICNQYLKVGSKVLVEGKLKPDENGSPRSWIKDGVANSSYEVTADNVVFMDSKSDAGGLESRGFNQDGQAQYQMDDALHPDNDELPF